MRNSFFGLLTILASCIVPTSGFTVVSRGSTMNPPRTSLHASNSVDDTSRRQAMIHWGTSAAALAALVFQPPEPAFAEDPSMYSPKFIQEYPDFIRTPAGWSYRVVTPPKSDEAAAAATLGDRVVFDWSGYTIGYFGRPFQAKGGPQGGAFDKDIDYSRAVLGGGAIVRGLEQAFVGMKPGEVRQVILPYGDLSYPEDDLAHERVGPKPTTFSGQRALNFVLENPRLDRTLLFNIKLIRVDRPNGRGGFVRG